MPEQPEVTNERFRHLPDPIRWEDLRTSQDVVSHDEFFGEADRGRSWLLRTAGAV